MSVEVAAVETPIQTPITPAAATPPPADGAAAPVAEPTIKEHLEARNGPEKRRRDADDARPEDREEIGSLTKRLREAEEASGIKRKPNESNRVYDLRVRTELAERLRDVSKKPESPKPEPRAAAAPAMPRVPEFTEKEPTLAQFKDDADPASAYLKALVQFERKRDQHEAHVAATERASKEYDGTVRQWWNTKGTEHAARLDTAIKAAPDLRAKLEAIGEKPLSPILFGAIQIHPESVKMMTMLADHPDLHDELFLLTDGKPIGDPTRNPLVSIVQRKLLAKAQTVQAPERSPKPQWKPPAPPPSPVRTQPTAIASQPDKESGGIMAHVRKHPVYRDRD